VHSDEQAPGGFNHTPMVDEEESTLTAGIIKDAALSSSSTFKYVKTGAIEMFDMNESDTHTTTVEAFDQGYLGSLSVSDPNTTDSTTNGQAAWRFELEHSDMSSLTVDESLTQEYKVIFTDNAGATAETTLVITITGTDGAPNVAITSPNSGEVFGPADVIDFIVEANDAEGSVSEVQFYDGNTLVHTDTTAPYSHRLTGAAVGNHSLTAKAVDNAGNEATANAVQVSVTAAAPITITDTVNDPVAIGTQTNFSAQASGGSGGLQYKWVFGDGTETAYSSSSAASHTKMHVTAYGTSTLITTR